MNNKTTKTDIYNIDPRNIVVVEGFNSRIDFGNIAELAEQIKEQGLLNPISVVPFKNENGEEKYRLVDGERRYRAIMLNIENGVDISRVKALFLSKSSTDEQLYIQQMMRNEGKPFTEYELGILCAKLRDKCGKTISEIAKMLGKNAGVISYALADLEYDERIQEMLKKGEICGADVRRVFTASKEKYGKDKYEEKAIAELLNLKEKAKKDGNNENVSIKDCSIVIDAKDTKSFIKGMNVFLRYLEEYSKKNGGEEVEVDIAEMYNTLKNDSSLSLRDMFNKAIKNAG